MFAHFPFAYHNAWTNAQSPAHCAALWQGFSLYDVIGSGDYESAFWLFILDEAASVCEEFELWI
jgi:hypothetical protein